MDTNYWLDRVKRERNIESDYHLSEVLNTTRQAISQQRNGKQEMSAKTAIRVAWLLRVNPITVLASVYFSREKDPSIRAFWKEVFRSTRRKGDRRKYFDRDVPSVEELEDLAQGGTQEQPPEKGRAKNG